MTRYSHLWDSCQSTMIAQLRRNVEAVENGQEAEVAGDVSDGP